MTAQERTYSTSKLLALSALYDMVDSSGKLTLLYSNSYHANLIVKTEQEACNCSIELWESPGGTCVRIEIADARQSVPAHQEILDDMFQNFEDVLRKYNCV
ncbi:MAG: hypothetical protein QM296_06535 [Bacillota bacterium]|nr:hypothetical protein [Bacillota bacterium]